MKYAINIPNYGEFSDPNFIKKFASDVEKSGWDGLFIWDHIQLYPEYLRGTPFIDPWAALNIIAMNTSNIKLGSFVTPLSRRRPWQVSRQIVSLDHLSEGRAMLGVGLGTPVEFEFGAFGEATDDKTRAELLDESLEIILKLWTGEAIDHTGKHYHLTDVQILPKPYKGHIPIFIAGQWPNKRPMRRAANYDGVVPISNNWPEKLSPNDIGDILSYISKYRISDKQFELMVGGETPDDKDKA